MQGVPSFAGLLKVHLFFLLIVVGWRVELGESLTSGAKGLVELLCVRSDDGVVVPEATFHFDQGFDGGLDFLVLFDGHRFSLADGTARSTATAQPLCSPSRSRGKQ